MSNYAQVDVTDAGVSIEQVDVSEASTSGIEQVDIVESTQQIEVATS